MTTNDVQLCLIVKQWYEYKQQWFEKDKQTNKENNNTTQRFNKVKAFQQQDKKENERLKKSRLTAEDGVLIAKQKWHHKNS